jgi:hypothetical protein
MLSRPVLITLKFENFTKTNLVTLLHVRNEWKVPTSINLYNSIQ